MRGLTLCVLLPFAPTAALAGPGAQLLNDWRVLSFAAQGDSKLGGQTEQSEYTPDFEFADFSAGDSLLSTGAQSAVASVMGTMNSALSATAMTFDASVSGTVTIFDETAYNASAFALARHQVSFSLAQATTWRLVATLDGSGAPSGVADILLSEGAFPGGAAVGSWSSTTLSMIDTQIILGPGAYTMTMEARANLSIFAQSTESADAMMNASFTLVPAPGGAGLGALAVAMGARRRRRFA